VAKSNVKPKSSNIFLAMATVPSMLRMVKAERKSTTPVPEQPTIVILFDGRFKEARLNRYSGFLSMPGRAVFPARLKNGDDY
jgi:hypothetical protein